MEVVRLKMFKKHLFQDLELDLANPISIFVQKKYLFASAYLDMFSLAASYSNF